MYGIIEQFLVLVAIKLSAVTRCEGEKAMGEVKTTKLNKKRNPIKKVLLILIVAMVTFGVLGFVAKQKGLIDIDLPIDLPSFPGKQNGEVSVAKQDIQKSLKNMGYAETRVKDLSIFSTKRGGKNYRCNLYYKPKLKGNVELSSNMPQPTNKGMWAVVKDLTLNDSKFKETLVLLLSLTDNKIDLKDIQKRLEKNIKKNRAPASNGIYSFRVEKRKHSLHLRANWHRGKLYLEYGVDI
jgi:hypothetical protein